MKPLGSTLLTVALLVSLMVTLDETTHAGLIPSDADLSAIQWSPDGSKLAISTFSDVYVYDEDFRLLGQYLTDASPSDPNHVRPNPRWSPDGTRIAAGRMILDAATVTPSSTTDSIFPLGQWSPDGRYAISLAADYRGTEWYDAQTGTLARKVVFRDLIVSVTQFPFLSPDGTRFVSRVGNDLLTILDAVTGETLSETDFPYEVSPFVWDNTGTRVAFWSYENTLASTPGSIPQTGNTGRGYLVYVHIMDVVKNQVIVKSAPISNYPRWLQWSNDDSMIIGPLGDNSIRAWESSTGELLGEASFPGEIVASDISPFGGRYAVALGALPPLLAMAQTSGNMTAYPLQTQLEGRLQIVVPAFSNDYLQRVTANCDLQPALERSLMREVGNDTLEAFTERLTNMTDSQIPPGCRADLLAVATALQAQATP